MSESEMLAQLVVVAKIPDRHMAEGATLRARGGLIGGKGDRVCREAIEHLFVHGREAVVVVSGVMEFATSNLEETQTLAWSALGGRSKLKNSLLPSNA